MNAMLAAIHTTHEYLLEQGLWWDWIAKARETVVDYCKDEMINGDCA